MFYLSSTCSSYRTIPEIAKELTEWGVHNIELSGNFKYYDGLLTDLVHIKEEFDIEFMIHWFRCRKICTGPYRALFRKNI